ncbi:nitroreductase family protein [Actinopolymorpha alba]|uniref:nitroreductase family protein n=1 Tax=Actinopolymorpha alba TaxID=533267 RepID=UPI00037D783F|nr:nitroreductase family protein [Actinopolymorpha alba]
MTELIDLAVTDHLLSTTRAVRKRLDLERPVEREVLLDCLRLATQAPTGSNSQGWRWVVVFDADKRARLGELYRAGGEAYLRAAGATASPNAQQARVQESARYLMDVIDRVPVLVIPCIEGRITDLRHAAAFFGSIHPAVWSFQLALRSRGLGSVWTTFHLAYEREAAELLGIPDSVTQAAMLPVAYTIGTDFRPAKRRPVEEITYWNTWGDTLGPGE